MQKKKKTTAKTRNKESSSNNNKSMNKVNGCKVEKNKIICTIQSHKSHLRVAIKNYKVTAKVFNQNLEMLINPKII